jgi:tryptophan synthase beta chain
VKDAHSVPKSWFNVLPDLPFSLDPPLHPQTGQPLRATELEAIFAPALVEQEFSNDHEIEIPDEVRELYATYRPTPLRRARHLEQRLNTPAEIYYKYEGASPVGSHKLNTALAQAYYNRQAGTRKLATETGAGQWGAALSLAGKLLGLEVEVFMVRISAEQKPERLHYMRAMGAEVHSSPSERTEFGKSILARDPNCSGSLGIAISEALEVVIHEKGARYSLGSVLNHVLLHQTVIGQEAKAQLAEIGRIPDLVIACHGGGSNFGGIALPFLPDRLSGRHLRLIAVEPDSCPSLTRGTYTYDSGDTAGLTPQLMMYTLGRDFIPPVIHAGGLRYHGASPLISALVHHGLVEAQSVGDEEVYQAASLFLETEGILAAPESSHAIAQTIRAAVAAREEERHEVILFNLSGHGLYDLAFYDRMIPARVARQSVPL